MDRVEHCDAPDEKLVFEFLSELGNYNRLPQPWQEATLDEFYHCAGCWCIEYMDHRQILASDDEQLKDDPRFKRFRPCQIYFYHDCAFAFFWPVEHHYQGDSIVYADKPFVFRIGCEHNMRELSQAQSRELGVAHHGICYHVYRCSKCKIIRAYDSSG